MILFIKSFINSMKTPIIFKNNKKKMIFKKSSFSRKKHLITMANKVSIYRSIYNYHKLQ